MEQDLLNRVPSGIGICENSKGDMTVLYLNDGYYQMIGQTREERGSDKTRDFFRYMYPDDVCKIKMLEAAIEKGSDIENCNYRILCGDRGYRWIHMASSVIKREAGVITTYCSYTDVDEAVRSRAKLEQVTDEEIEYVLLVDAHNEATIVVDLNPSLIRVKVDKTIIFHKIPNSPYFDRVKDTDRQSVIDFYNIDNISKRLADKTIASNTYSCISNEGVATRKEERAFYLDETHDNIVIVRRDITESYDKELEQKENLQKALDAANAANEAKSEFLSRMSHDLRTPMNGIVGMTRLVRDSKTDEERNHYLTQLDASSTYLLGLLNDILNNAVKFTPRGGQVNYTACHVERDGKIWCHHVISDNGVGMSPEFQRTLFTPFVQEKNSESGFVTGTGLGLSICRKLCDLMGGSIQVESKLGKGTTFTVDIPTTPLTEEEYEQHVTKTSEHIKTASIAAVLKGKKVIICEDHPVNREIMERLLEKKGMITMSAENGREGVRLFTDSKEGEISAILMDIRMPVMDGIAAAKVIRRLGRTDATAVPIIAISANAFEEDIHASANAGMNDHLAKPVDPDRLYEVLSRWMKE